MDFVQNVFFGDVQVDNFEYLDTTGISGVVPAAAYSSEVFVETDSSTLSLGEVNVVLDSASQVSVGELEIYSGNAGDLIQLTGENFYQITDVRFGHADHLTGQFFVTSPNELNVIVPSGAEWKGISVSSSLRTGLSGSTSESSGISPNEFVIIPDITGVSTGQEISGANVDILGRDFDAVTGVNFNNLNTGITLIDSNTVRAKVPNGDVWGAISLELRSGLLTSGNDNLRFKSLAKITGVGPAAGGGTYSSQTIDSEVAFVESGDFAAISGHNFVPEILYDAKNFDLASSGYLVGFGQEGSTGLFNIISSTVMTGKIPSTCPTGKSNIFLYSNHYPEAFPSDVDFLLKYSNPIIDSVNPPSGLPSDTINIIGRNLYGITGFDITGHAVGVGTAYSEAFIAESKGGKSVTVTLGSNLNNVTYEAFYDIALSGHYGNAKMETGNGEAGFMVYGIPSVTTIDPTINISPNQTGVISGVGFYSGDLRLSLLKDSVSNTITDLSVSGFDDVENTNNNRFRFKFPNTFETGKYRLRLFNERASTINNLGGVLGVYQYPVLSGFTPGTGTIDETTITVSGAFQAITGLKVGDVTIDNYVTQSNSEYTTGIQFVPTVDVASAPVEVLTSGGNETSVSGLGLIPGKPKVSGFWIGESKDKPLYVNGTGDIIYSQVFGVDDAINISGQRLNLVSGISFSGSESKLPQDVFLSQSYENITLQIPDLINPNSGNFEVVDTFARTGDMSKFPTGVNVLSLSGIEKYGLPGEEIKASGSNLNGMYVGFSGITGDVKYIESDLVSSASGVDTIKVNVPTGIQVGGIIFSGRQNSGINVASDLNAFCPISAIEGVSYYNNTVNVPNLNSLNTGDKLTVTGSNFHYPIFGKKIKTDVMGLTNSIVAFITGTGYNVARFPEEKTGVLTAAVYATGFRSGIFSSYSPSALDLAAIELPPYFIGTGNLVLLSPSLPLMGKSAINSMSNEKVQHYSYGVYDYSDIYQDCINYFPNTLTIQGTYVDVTGMYPSGGITGTEVTLSGQGFDQVTDAFFVLSNERVYNSRSLLQRTGEPANKLSSFPEYYSGQASPIVMPSKETTFVSDTVMRVRVPELSVSQSSQVEIVLQGGTNARIKNFEVFVGNQAFVEKVITNQEASPEISSGQVGEYTVEETIQGDVWYVTYKKYPDGTKTIINSFPKP